MDFIYTKKATSEQVEGLKKLGLSAEEIEETLKADFETEHDIRHDYDLSEEQEKQAKKMANVDTHKKKTAIKREQKPDPEKENLVQSLSDFLETCAGIESVKITNKTKEVSFIIGDFNYSLSLTRHRKEKKKGD